MKFLSVVIPFYNEEENVIPVLKEVLDVLRETALPFEIVAVDDGSTDDTWKRLEFFKQTVSELKLVKMRGNFGQTHAMAAGISSVKGDWILTMDGDGQNDPHSLPALLAKTGDGYDVISGWRKKRKDSAILRTIPSRIANALIASLTGLKLHDSGCSLKLYRARALRSIELYSDRHRFIPFLLSMRGFRVTEVVVGHRPRLKGRSKYGFSRTFKVILDLLTLALFARFRENPRLYFFLAALPFAAAAAGAVFFSILQTGGQAGIQGSITYSGAAVLFVFAALSLVVNGFLAEWLGHHERE